MGTTALIGFRNNNDLKGTVCRLNGQYWNLGIEIINSYKNSTAVTLKDIYYKINWVNKVKSYDIRDNALVNEYILTKYCEFDCDRLKVLLETNNIEKATKFVPKFLDFAEFFNKNETNNKEEIIFAGSHETSIFSDTVENVKNKFLACKDIEHDRCHVDGKLSVMDYFKSENLENINYAYIFDLDKDILELYAAKDKDKLKKENIELLCKDDRSSYPLIKTMSLNRKSQISKILEFFILNKRLVAHWDYDLHKASNTENATEIDVVEYLCNMLGGKQSEIMWEQYILDNLDVLISMLRKVDKGN